MLPTPLCFPQVSVSRRSRGAARAAPLSSCSAAILAAGAAIGIRRGSMRAGTAPLLSSAVAGDTQVVYGPRVFDTPTGAATNHVERFAVAVQPGRRYTLRVDNGNP